MEDFHTDLQREIEREREMPHEAIYLRERERESRMKVWGVKSFKKGNVVRW